MSAKDVFDFLSAGGTLAILVLLSLALLAGRLVGRERLDEQLAETKRERAEKLEALAMGREAVAAVNRLADALEARNTLEAERLRADERREAAARRNPRPSR